MAVFGIASGTVGFARGARTGGRKGDSRGRLAAAPTPRGAGQVWGTITLRARYRASAAAFAFAFALLVGPPPGAAEPQRTLRLYNIHTKETLTSTYKKNGKHVAAEMEKINWILRDWRRDEATTMDPELIDLLWEIHTELGSAEPIHVISGYRSRATNDLLRRTVGGQARQSRHILGKAADVHFPDVPVRRLRYSALIREKGGVGYYPTSAIPFVHVDIDKVRSWPRLPRAELALLFPSGRTRHLPDDGQPIGKQDVREARARHKELAAQLAEFHADRGKPRPPVLTASLTPPLPQLLSPPRLVERPPRLLAQPASASRQPALYREPSVVAAPAYDEEHPEELSYRPFPIAPFLTATASADDPALAVMVHPDLRKVLELLDQDHVSPPMRLRPGMHEAQLMWAQQSKGEPVDLSVLTDASQLDGRKVATKAQ
jgi:uncharacterized protein YcbK (DUF882 family)